MKFQHMTVGFKISETAHIYNAVVNSFKTAGIRIVSPGSTKWNVVWTGVAKPEMLKDLAPY